MTPKALAPFGASYVASGGQGARGGRILIDCRGPDSEMEEHAADCQADDLIANIATRNRAHHGTRLIKALDLHDRLAPQIEFAPRELAAAHAAKVRRLTSTPDRAK